MEHSAFCIAQCNISRLKAPLDHPDMQEFTKFLEPVNTFADTHDGFLWRLKDEKGEASSKMDSGYEDKMIIINISVWRDIPSLQKFTFGTVHSYFMRSRNKWMTKVERTQFGMWWIPQGSPNPSIETARAKLEMLDTVGPTSRVFNWQTQFDPAGNLLTLEKKIA